MIITYTRERKCKDCLNLKYYYPNPKKFYSRHICIVKNQSMAKNENAGRCNDFIFNPIGIPEYLKTE